MNGIILIDKPKNYTSRDIVNIMGKKLHTKKIGHTGTLDPIATGVLVLCVGKYTKLVDILTSYNKEYIATVILGIETDTLDITGTILKEEKCSISIDKIKTALEHFEGKYIQEVPKYSAVKINGKKLYEYARNNEDVVLPKREVEIKNIELIDKPIYESEKTIFKFKTTVSKGTYIRSLIKDIGAFLGVKATMKELRRTRQGNFSIDECNKIDDINYKVLNIEEIVDYPIINIKNDKLKNQVLNGALIENIYENDIVMFKLDNNVVALYKIYDKDKSLLKPYKMLL